MERGVLWNFSIWREVFYIVSFSLLHSILFYNLIFPVSQFHQTCKLRYSFYSPIARIDNFRLREENRKNTHYDWPKFIRWSIFSTKLDKSFDFFWSDECWSHISDRARKLIFFQHTEIFFLPHYSLFIRFHIRAALNKNIRKGFPPLTLCTRVTILFFYMLSSLHHCNIARVLYYFFCLLFFLKIIQFSERIAEKIANGSTFGEIRFMILSGL